MLMSLSTTERERLEYLEKRCRDMEDVLIELAPFAACHEVRATTTLAAPTDDEAIIKGQKFKRDTLFMDKQVYRRAAKLVKERLLASGIDYIFAG